MAKVKKIWITRNTQYGLDPFAPYILWRSKPYFWDEEWILDCNDSYVTIKEGDTVGFEKIFNVHFKGGSRSITCRRLVK